MPPMRRSAFVSPAVLAMVLLAASACGKIPDVSAVGDVDAGGGPCGPVTCAPQAMCTDPVVGTCECNEGYEGSGTTCTDIDECDTPGGGAELCSAHATCVNRPGSFDCECDDGYRDDGTGQCLDIDECESSTACPAGAACANTEGSFTCTCRFGYTADGSGGCKNAWNQIYSTNDQGIDAVAGLDKRIYVVHEGSGGTSRFFSYDVTNGNVRTENAVLDDFCACGYGGTLVAADGAIYHFAGAGQRYQPSTQTWQARAYPAAVQTGEMFGAMLGDSLYYFGGRDNVQQVRRFYRAGNSWQVLASTFPGAGEPLAVGVTDRELFLFSVRSTDGNNTLLPQLWRMNLSNLTPGAATPTLTWSQMPDGPGLVRYGDGAYFLNKLRFIVDTNQGAMIASFDPAAGQWDPTFAPVPEGSFRGNMIVVDGRLFYVSTDNFDVRIDELAVDP